MSTTQAKQNKTKINKQKLTEPVCTVPLNVERRRGEKEEKETETTQSTRADQQRSDGSTEKGEPFMMSLTATMPVIVTVTLTGQSLLLPQMARPRPATVRWID